MLVEGDSAAVAESSSPVFAGSWTGGTALAKLVVEVGTGVDVAVEVAVSVAAAVGVGVDAVPTLDSSVGEGDGDGEEAGAVVWRASEDEIDDDSSRVAAAAAAADSSDSLGRSTRCSVFAASVCVCGVAGGEKTGANAAILVD